ncbi:hypothetical protein HOP62_01435 [Halomonas sp. MCCC 1A17488]|uniref:FimV/HubP family polar landmark protein n=1 Tax=unclassified Halomonas TaxID=2609666 RepID=UPI0018D2206D|nr:MULTISPECIES: FimV/HubP family polar landmark protein [unclassified Halomonas]MCE8014736.1 hypothetical protein [Halomonas sp. MCCC 1A17488]MCG3238069.1 hypothetical protein [Halomonas sp. MCCC 1A17488]QPP48155.1 hypothetical protein I4484_12965 [Halomonas sp. SS10-MC5]
MKRKLTYAMLLALSAAGPQALALGVGEAQVRSPLNAPLRAVIPLTDTDGLDPERLRVSVAGAREFESAGLSRTPLAASVRADVEVRQGQWVVSLSSERAVREPWMDLLLRFDWPSGRQLREVTLLLDPPDYDRMPVLVSGSSRQPVPAARSAAEAQVADAEPDASGLSAAPAGERNSAEERAWVGSGDTLWSVASRLRPDAGVSMDQMMVALVEANPDAFPSGNINAMRAGYTLTVPSREAIAARSAQEASQMVQAMNQAWASRGNGAPARVPLGARVAAVGELEAAAMSVAQAIAEPSGTPGESTASEQGMAAEAALPAPRLTLLSDEELAAESAMGAAVERDRAAANAGEEGGRAEGWLDADVLATLGAGELALAQDDPRFALLERRWQESRAALEAVQTERDALQHELGNLRDEVEAMREQLAALLASNQAAVQVGSGGAVVQAEKDEPGESPWWGAAYPVDVDRNLLLGGAGLAALLGLWLWVRRRQRRDAVPASGGSAMPNMVHGMPPSDHVAVPPGAAAGPAPLAAAGMSLDEPETHREELPRATMPQAEAISEADIFMAYGRYDQAREMLEAGLAREPERHDLRLKLLNVHVEQGDRQAAEREAQRLAETGDSALVAEAGRLLAKLQPAAPDPDSLANRAEPPRTAAAAGSESLAPAVGRQEPPLPAEREPLDAPRSELAGREDASSAQAEPLRAEEPGVTPSSPDDEAPPGDGKGPTPADERGESLEWRTIDYQPPALDPDPPSREETPMQPSVEFPRMDAALGEAGEAEWEVEEVAFPPLDRDNGVVLGEAGGRDDLQRARHLLESGDAERARPLLQRLLKDASDPQVRSEAQDLFTHYRL